MIANTSFELGRSFYRYVNGDIDAATLWENSGSALLRGSSAYYCGIVGQLLIPAMPKAPLRRSRRSTSRRERSCGLGTFPSSTL